MEKVRVFCTRYKDNNMGENSSTKITEGLISNMAKINNIAYNNCMKLGSSYNDILKLKTIVTFDESPSSSPKGMLKDLKALGFNVELSSIRCSGSWIYTITGYNEKI